jgi:hypothetical protein
MGIQKSENLPIIYVFSQSTLKKLILSSLNLNTGLRIEAQQNLTSRSSEFGNMFLSQSKDFFLNGMILAVATSTTSDI